MAEVRVSARNWREEMDFKNVPLTQLFDYTKLLQYSHPSSCFLPTSPSFSLSPFDWGLRAFNPDQRPSEICRVQSPHHREKKKEKKGRK